MNPLIYVSCQNLGPAESRVFKKYDIISVYAGTHVLGNSDGFPVGFFFEIENKQLNDLSHLIKPVYSNILRPDPNLGYYLKESRRHTFNYEANFTSIQLSEIENSQDWLIKPVSLSDIGDKTT